jgi:PEP-CTERM motif-containing protein
MPSVSPGTETKGGLAMRFRTVMLGVFGLLGCTAESLADPIDLSRLKRASNAASLQSHLNQALPPRGLAIETPANITVLDANVSISESELTENALHFSSLTAQPTALPNWSLEGTGSAATRLSKHDLDKFKPKKPKDKCEGGGPCPTTVPEPATAMLLIIGLGLARVAGHYRLRL